MTSFRLANLSQIFSASHTFSIKHSAYVYTIYYNTHKKLNKNKTNPDFQLYTECH